MADAKAKSENGMMTMVVVILLLSLMGAGSGFAVGIFIKPGTEETAPVSPAAALNKGTGAAEASQKGKIEEQHGEGAQVEGEAGIDAEAPAAAEAHLKIIAIPPVVTMLAAPEGKWIRFEGAILVEPDAETPPELLAEQSGEHVFAYLRTLKLQQLHGPSGLLALKDDLNDTVSALSKGQVRGLLIHGLLVE